MPSERPERAAGPRAHTSRALVVLAFALVSVLWGSTYLGIRIALESFPPFSIGAARFFGAGTVLLVLARVRGERAPTRTEWAASALSGTLFFVVGNGMVNLAERSVSSGLVSVLVATMPLWMSVFARLLGEPSSRAETVGVLLGVAGVIVLNNGGDLRASKVGAVLGLVAPMGWALGSMASRRFPAAPGLTGTAAPMLTGGALMGLSSLVLREHLGPSVSAKSVAAVLYLGVFGSLVGFSAYTFLLRHTRPAVATSYAYVNPVVAVLLGVVFAGERVSLSGVGGACIVLVAVVVVARARGGRAPK